MKNSRSLKYGLLVAFMAVGLTVTFGVPTQYVSDVSVGGDECGAKTAEGCCTGKGESWCASLRECVSPGVKPCPSGGGGNPGGGGTPRPTNPAPSQTCPSGGTASVGRSACETTFCPAGQTGIFYNDNDRNNVACCRCAAATQQPTQPVATGGACSGSLSASACRNSKPGDIIGGDVCQCQSTGNNNCACVGLGNRGEGARCSAETNCRADLTCSGGVCISKEVAKTRPKPIERTVCGSGYCAEGYTCQNGSICVLATQAKIGNGSRFPRVNFGPDSQRQIKGKKPPPPELPTYYDTSLQRNIKVNSCEQGSGGRIRLVGDQNFTTKAGYCCKNIDENTPINVASKCLELKNQGQPVEASFVPTIVSNQTSILATYLDNGSRCVDFRSKGAGAVTAANILNARGFPVQTPGSLNPAIINACDPASIEEVAYALNKSGVPTRYAIVGDEDQCIDPTNYDYCNDVLNNPANEEPVKESLANGNDFIVTAQVCVKSASGSKSCSLHTLRLVSYSEETGFCYRDSYYQANGRPIPTDSLEPSNYCESDLVNEANNGVMTVKVTEGYEVGRPLR